MLFIESTAASYVPTADDAPDHDHLVLCKPCAGLLAAREPACTRAGLEANHRFSTHELSARRSDAPGRPSVFAPARVAIRREPRSVRERVVDDTPLRFARNHRGIRWALTVAVGYVLQILVLAL